MNKAPKQAYGFKLRVDPSRKEEVLRELGIPVTPEFMEASIIQANLGTVVQFWADEVLIISQSLPVVSVIFALIKTRAEPFEIKEELSDYNLSHCPKTVATPEMAEKFLMN